jgi:hypothetical protein
MGEIPKLSTWSRYILRTWNPPELEGKDKSDLIAMAMLLETYSTNGTKIFPSAARLAEHLGCRPQTAERRRRECVKYGLFTQYGRLYGRIPMLQRAIPNGAVKARPKAEPDNVVPIKKVKTHSRPKTNLGYIRPCEPGEVCEFCEQAHTGPWCSARLDAFRSRYPEEYAKATQDFGRWTASHRVISAGEAG